MDDWKYEVSSSCFDGQVIVQEIEGGDTLVVSSPRQHSRKVGPLVASAPALLKELRGMQLVADSWAELSPSDAMQLIGDRIVRALNKAGAL